MFEGVLIMFGLQNDFLSLGNAEIPGLEAISQNIKDISGNWKYHLVVNQNHPADHLSFAACHPWRKPHQIIQIGEKTQYLWPIHCVSGTLGMLNPKWMIDLHPFVLSPFSGRDGEDFWVFKNDSFQSYLEGNKMNHLYICGFPLDFEIKENCIFALKQGYKVTLITNCILSLDREEEARIYAVLHSSGACLQNTGSIK